MVGDDYVNKTSLKETGRRDGKPLISVIMPCYNAESFLSEAIDSVLRQTYPNVEVIIVDDGSTDGSRKILSAYGDRVKLLTQENQGPYLARNHGLKNALGEYVAFLDADDWWSPDCLSKLYKALNNHPDCALAYCGWQKVGALDRGTHPFVPKNYEQADKAELLLMGGSPWPIHAALVRRVAIEQIGGFREDLSTSLDYELWLRLSAANPVTLVPEVLAFYRFHGEGQISSKPYRQALNGWRIKRRFLQENPDVLQLLGRDRVRQIVDQVLLQRGYDFFWHRDLVSAQQVFRHCLTRGVWRPRELKYLLPALLPGAWYRGLVTRSEQRSGRRLGGD